MLQVRKSQHLGEVLAGDRMMKTLFELPFAKSFTGKKLCSYTLKPQDIETMQHAIDNDYYFEFIYDDLPLWGFVGDVSTSLVDGHNITQYHLFTHYKFLINFNSENGQGQVIEVSWDHDPAAVLDISDSTNPIPVTFRYSAHWTKTHLESRDAVAQDEPQHLEVRWFSIFNSIVTVLLLTGFLATILMRVLKADLLRYAQSDEEGHVVEEESGWKLVHGDVFRYPSNKEALCAVLGNGSQLVCMCVGILALACLGVYSKYNRGALLVAALLVFALTSGNFLMGMYACMHLCVAVRGGADTSA